jgi:quercetin dioxygenase-like cupin family protein
LKLNHSEMVSIAAITLLGCVGCAPPVVTAPTMTRVPVLQTDTTGGNEAHMWVAEIEPGAETGLHVHPTPRFVYVLEGAVVLEIDGQPDRSFAAGEGFQELPGVVHNFRNASTTRSASAMGFQIAAPGQALQDQASDQRSER